MSTSNFVIEPLGSQHDRAAFDCGNESLNRYLHRQAGQDLRKRAAVPFVLADRDSGAIAGYYTLSAYQIDVGELPPNTARRFPRYPYAPATLLGRLAVDRRHQGKGLGEFLLVDALLRALAHSSQVASLAVVVDAIDDAARSFYERYGFIRLPNHPHKLFLPMDTIKMLGPEPSMG